MKVFLSHSSHEKSFVEKVALRLSRANVQLDKHFFHTGDQLLDGIRHALTESAIFCFFASEAALKSFWVNFEISEAEKLAMRQKLRPMVFFIEAGLRIEDLPVWLREFHVSPGPSPSIVARHIEIKLCSQTAGQVGHLFVGREDLLLSFSERLLPVRGHDIVDIKWTRHRGLNNGA